MSLHHYNKKKCGKKDKTSRFIGSTKRMIDAAFKVWHLRTQGSLPVFGMREHINRDASEALASK